MLFHRQQLIPSYLLGTLRPPHRPPALRSSRASEAASFQTENRSRSFHGCSHEIWGFPAKCSYQSLEHMDFFLFVWCFNTEVSWLKQSLIIKKIYQPTGHLNKKIHDWFKNKEIGLKKEIMTHPVIFVAPKYWIPFTPIKQHMF